MPATPVITVTPGASANAVAFANSDTPGSGNRLYRQAQGEYDSAFILIAEGIAVDATFTDSNIKSDVLYTYRGGAVDSGVEALSVAKTGQVSLAFLTLHRVTKTSLTANRTGNFIELYPLDSFHRDRVRAYTEHHASDSDRDVVLSPITTNTWRGTCVISGGAAARQDLEQMSRDLRQVCLRDALGNRLFGVLTLVDFAYGLTDLVDIEVTGNGYSEVVEPAVSSPVLSNGFTQDEVMRAVRGYYGPVVYRRRAELLDFQLNKIRDLRNVLEAQVGYIADKDIQRAADFEVKEANALLDPFSAQVLALDGLLFFLKFNDASGVAVDSSPNGRNFTNSGTPGYGAGSLTAGEPADTATEFNGDDFFNRAHESWMNVTNIQLGLWFKTTGNNQTLFDRNDGSTNFWRFDTDSQGRLQFAVNFTTGSPTTFNTGVSVKDGLPHLLLASFDGAYIRIDIDGALVLKVAETRAMKSTGSMGLNVGFTNAGTNAAIGTFAKAFMVNRALTAREKRDLWQAGANKLSEILYEQDLIKLGYDIRMDEDGADGEPWAPFDLGVFKPVVTSRQAEAGAVYRRFQGFDYLTHALANTVFGTRWTVAAGQNYLTGTNGVLDIIEAAGIDPATLTVTPTSHTLPTAVDFETGTNALIAVNILLEAIAYDPLRGTESGGGIIAPMVLPSARASELELVTDGKSVVENRAELTLNTDRVANKIIVSIESVDRTPDSGEATNSKVTSPLSTVHRGIKPKEVVVNAVNSTVAGTLAANFLERGSAKAYSELRLNVVPLPWLGHEPRVTVRHTNFAGALGVEDEFLLRAWKLPVKAVPEKMSLEFAVVQSVSS